MTNKIDTVFKQNGLKIMTHVVCGYPDIRTTIDLVKTMEDSGVDMVELQIPFSDPMADGPVIMHANQQALDGGTTVGKCFETADKLKSIVDIPLLFMSYANIPFVMGVENFCMESSKAGISGFIIPDIPYDENMDFYRSSENSGIHFIPVVSPGISEKRLADISILAKGFIYATLRVGTTGTGKLQDPESIDLINRIRNLSTLPVGAGFGISSPSQVTMLRDTADCVIIGSHLINLYQTNGTPAVGAFIKECRVGILKH